MEEDVITLITSDNKEVIIPFSLARHSAKLCLLLDPYHESVESQTRTVHIPFNQELVDNGFTILEMSLERNVGLEEVPDDLALDLLDLSVWLEI